LSLSKGVIEANNLLVISWRFEYASTPRGKQLGKQLNGQVLISDTLFVICGHLPTLQNNDVLILKPTQEMKRHIDLFHK